MNQLVPLPTTKCLIRKEYIQQATKPAGFVEGYLVAVCVVANEAPKLMVMTHEGAMFCYVPPNAIAFKEEAPHLPLAQTCKWDCLADRGEIVELDFARNFEVKWEGGIGRYMWTLHFDPRQMWGRLPEQLKLFHFLEGEDGNLHIVVNNQCQWICGAVHKGGIEVVPEPNTKVWYVEEYDNRI